MADDSKKGPEEDVSEIETRTGSNLVINAQPLGQVMGTLRAELPVNTVDWRSTTSSHFIPRYGLDFLIGVSSLLIQQTMDVSDLTVGLESANRYTIMVPRGEALYIAHEKSEPRARCLCGPGRSFTMHLLDPTHQPALILDRRLATSGCCFPCRQQEMKVWCTSEDYIGRIEQCWTWMTPIYEVKSATEELLFVIEGPSVLCWSSVAEAVFTIKTSDRMNVVGSIEHRWDRELVSFATTVKFPEATVQPKHKAILLAATFLLEYTYFIQSKSNYAPCSCFL